ncbi:hypothetical protein N9V29_04790 [Flavobacteriales bacterium]|nr:hypothetical protein [Flavobacteriales bacterium]
MNPKSLVCSACIFLLFYCARGQSVTLTLDNVPETVQCNEVWTEQDVSLSFVTTTTDDCAPGGCYFAANGPAVGFAESVMIWPSRLTVDLTGLPGIQTIEVDIVDYCGFYCTQAFLMDTDGIVSIKGNSEAGSETLILDNPSQAALTELAISGCESGLNEIRIYQNTSSIINVPAVDRKVVRIVDLLGRDVSFHRGQLLFHIYDDGTVEKKVVIE